MEGQDFDGRKHSTKNLRNPAMQIRQKNEKKNRVFFGAEQEAVFCATAPADIV